MLREVAWRVFAGEYNQASLQVTEGGERAPSFVVTPLGARVNRLLVMGVLTTKEPVGEGGEMWRARITDPTGQFVLFAGQYQPEAAKALAEMEVPSLVAIVAKSRAYNPEPGVTLVSLRPERITKVSREERDHWNLHTGKQTLQRLQAVEAALGMQAPTPEGLVAATGCSRDLAEGLVQALQHYGPPEVAAYKGMVRDALEMVVTGRAPDRPPSLPPPTRQRMAVAAPAEVQVVGGPPAGPAAPAAAPAEDAALAAEEKVGALVRQLDEGKGAPWDGIVAEAGKQGLSEAAVEEAINSLLDKGLLYEPVLGRLRPAG